MSNQYQHIIPQVYLKQFGFLKFDTKWFVSVRNIDKMKWEDREIKRFLGEKNIYTLEGYEEISELIIEQDLNGAIEQRLPKIINQLNDQRINKNIQMAIAETTANFLCRNRSVREWIEGYISRDDFRIFFDMLTRGTFESKHKADFVFGEMSKKSKKDIINTIMVFYINYVSLVLRNCSMEIFESRKGSPFFTSDNPVSLMGKFGYEELKKYGMEIYFPLSPMYLIKFYWYKPNCITKMFFGDKQKCRTKKATTKIYNYFNKTVIPSSAKKFIVSPISYV